jgi:L-rhamnonate dehydratase
MSVDDVVSAVREARDCIGPARPLMLDAWMQWTVPFTLEVAERVAEYHIQWIEEPLPPDDVAGYRELTSRSPIPIAGGEHEFTPFGFRQLVEERLHHVLQPDACWVGGMTAMVKIYAMAKEAGLRVVPHRGAEVWGLHAIAALDEAPLAESPRPWMHWARGQPPIIDAAIAVGTSAGFGVELDPV